MPVFNCISDCTRPCETVQDRVRLYKTVYTTPHEAHSTSELSCVNIVYKLYGIKLEVDGTVCSNRDKPCLIEYIRALFVHTRATFESKSYQLILRHG